MFFFTASCYTKDFTLSIVKSNSLLSISFIYRTNSLSSSFQNIDILGLKAPFWTTLSFFEQFSPFFLLYSLWPNMFLLLGSDPSCLPIQQLSFYSFWPFWSDKNWFWFRNLWGARWSTVYFSKPHVPPPSRFTDLNTVRNVI